MTDLLLKLFNVPVTDVARIARTSVGFYGVNPLYIMLAALVLGAGVVWLYRNAGAEISAVRRYLMALLRVALLALILGLLLRPVLSVTLESSVRQTLLFLFDTSGSMSEIKDQRSAQDDLKRVAMVKGVLDPAKGLQQPLTVTTGLGQTPRIELLKAAFKNPQLNLISSLAKDYDLAAFTFDRDVTEIADAAYEKLDNGATPQTLNLAWLDKLEAKGQVTALGDAIKGVIARQRGKPLAGVVLVTDGAGNSGSYPLEAAEAAGQEGVPLYIYGVGITSPKDIIVSTVFAQDVAFANDQVPITVRISSMGLAGQTAKLMVHMGQEQTEKDITFNADGEQLVTVNLTPKEKGVYDIRAYVPPREDEAVQDNNAATQRIRVIDGKIKVLMVEQLPRWEFQYAQAVLMRDRRIDAKFVLLEGDVGITRGRDTPYLPEFPVRKEDLFKYDVVILGDVDPKTFSAAQLDNLHEFVSKFGGAVIVLAGKRYMPAAYHRSVLEKMLPVELETLTDPNSVSAVASRPVRLELTAAGKASPMLRLAERETDSAARWAQLPPIYWVSRVARAKPAADVLVVDNDPAKATRYGKMPIIAAQQYGLGQMLYIGTDNLWRWRKNVGDKYHAALWGQMVQRMALPHLLGASKRTQLTCDQTSYTVGGKVTIFGRLYGEGFEPMSEPVIRGTCQVGDRQAEVLLRALPDRPGMYRGEFMPTQAGNYQFTVEHDKSSKLEFVVTEPKQELAETAMNESLLKQMAQRSGGAFFREEDLHSLPKKIGAKMERQESTLEVELWSSPFYFLLIVIVAAAEWIMRKASQLK
jgi:hypothetical protein